MDHSKGASSISTTAQNVGTSIIRGLEFSYSQASFNFLPVWLSHLGGFANLTLIEFNAPSTQMADRVTYRQLPQPIESSRVITNAALFYRDRRLNVEIAYNHTGRQPLSFDRISAVNDQYHNATNTLDAQIGITVRRGLGLRAQVKNFTDEINQKVVGSNWQLNYSLLDNGRAYYLGVAFAF